MAASYEAGAAFDFSVLSYNVWCHEGVVMGDRMFAIAKIIEEENFPEFVCLQEVTTNIANEFKKHPFWKHYYPSEIRRRPYFVLMLVRKDLHRIQPKFLFQGYQFTSMGRGLLCTQLNVHGLPIGIGTTHLENPVFGNLHIEERAKQCLTATTFLDGCMEDNIILCGDFNWIKEDEPMLLPRGWTDAWLCTNPDQPGLTLDTVNNAYNVNVPVPSSRMDRMLYKSTAFKAVSMKIIGNKPLDFSFEFTKDRTVKKAFPSDHYGIIARFKII